MNVFVGCSSRESHRDDYNRLADRLAEFIVKGKHNYLFGGCAYGLMGRIHKQVYGKKNSSVMVVIPEVYKSDLDDLAYNTAWVTKTINQRKDLIEQTADVLVFIPGGVGTIDELWNAIETKRNHEHNKPIIIVNVNNYFEHFLGMMNRMYTEGFAGRETKELFYVTSGADETITLLEKLAEEAC